MKEKKVMIVFLSLIGLIPLGHAQSTSKPGSQEIGFQQIWSTVKKNASGLKAAEHEALATEIEATRYSRHWYPRLYLTGKAFITNDPGASFMYTLEQREIQSTDFSPSLLNDPKQQFFSQGTLGLDLPLFEGGVRVAQTKMGDKKAEAMEWAMKAQLFSHYSSAVQHYATLLSLIEEKGELLSLRKSVQSTIDRYRIGSRKNPVGYSGLLGLKNLRNRIDGLLSANEAKEQMSRSELNALALKLPKNWVPKPQRVQSFLSQVFTSLRQQKSKNVKISAAVEAARKKAESLSYLKNAERSRFLPRVGLFAQGDLYSGSRSTATSYSTGAYLQWDLFSAKNLGSLDQAEHQSAAALSKAEELHHQMEGRYQAALHGVDASEKSLILLDESAELLRKQTKTARDLFKNGSINALQLVEVLNRRADLLLNRSKVELELLQMKSMVFLTTARENNDLGRSR